MTTTSIDWNEVNAAARIIAEGEGIAFTDFCQDAGGGPLEMTAYLEKGNGRIPICVGIAMMVGGQDAVILGVEKAIRVAATGPFGGTGAKRGPSLDDAITAQLECVIDNAGREFTGCHRLADVQALMTLVGLRGHLS